MSSNIFNQTTLSKFKNIRKTFLWVGVWILVAEFILGAILILTEDWSALFGKILATFLFLAIAFFVSVNNFIRIEKGDKTTQWFALIGFIANMVWLILATLLVWEVIPFIATNNSMRSGYYGYTSSYTLSAVAKLLLISVSVAGAGFWISNVLSIKETNRAVKPLKITAIVCELYIKFPKETQDFLKKNSLNKFTQNKAISKIHDSYRVTKEEKEELNTYRKK